ncbi:MAG: PucR family transcriptional regulator ligand-binding domain-containing protein [Tissierella sp.]|uniref:PucR family transcriptional regulator ligand-binding domain-containing protein n=1 Tax=Tissierella sp. TaxID=41274 RepID=UPI003F9663C8
MKTTVKDALELGSLNGSKIVAGKKGLDNEIRFINVMEVPDISDWISGYEMILTTAYPYRNNDTGWGKLIEDLKMEKLSAFAIKPDRYIDKIPQEVIDMGNKLNIPILELPLGARFDLIINDVMREIINKDYALIEKSQKIHKDFTDLILSGGGLKEIANILAKLTNAFVMIGDKDENILAESSNYKLTKNIDMEKRYEEKNQ